MITIKKTPCPDTDIEVNGVAEGSVLAGSTVDIQVTDGVVPVTPTSVTVLGNTVTIEVPAAGSAPVGATLMKTGQTTVFRTGDDADTSAEGRATDFLTLASNNPFNNLNRFTDELGGQTYTLNIVIDWSTYDGTTVLGYNKIENGVNINWTNAIDAALAESIGTFTSGWRLPNISEIINICNWRLAANRYLGYSPFGGLGGLINASIFWSSTTSGNNVGSAITFVNNTAVIAGTGKNASSSMRYFAVRTFTVTGTILT